MVRFLQAFLAVTGTLSIFGSAVATTDAGQTAPRLDTSQLGGVTAPAPEVLAAMHKSAYVLRARSGKLTQIKAAKTLLPHDPEGHVQAVHVAMGPTGNIYVNQRTVMCKSTDGGRTWNAFKRKDSGASGAGPFQILQDGTFVTVPGSSSGKTAGPLEIWVSQDEGIRWRPFSQLKLPAKYDERYLYGLFQLPDGTLLCGISVRDHLKTTNDWGQWISGTTELVVYRSTDKGKTWTSGGKICDWGHEGGVARMASGKLLAAVRYQRPLLPGDPPSLIELTGKSHQLAFGKYPKFPYKHVFLADSWDGGRTWKGLRPLTTVFGQCYGTAVGLKDGTAVLVHDHRYPRELSTGRAMISHDEGETWEDEVYYLYYGIGLSGYSQSVALKDGLILTVAGTSDYLPGRESWNAAVGHSDFTAIRWKPE